MTFAMDESLSFADHFVEYGFAVVKGLVDHEFCDEALDEVRRILADDRPLYEWDEEKPGTRYDLQWYEDMGRIEQSGRNAVLEKLYEQPRLRAAWSELHGGDKWDGVRNYHLFLKCYNPQPKQLREGAHIDFHAPPVPVLYRGFSFQVALVDTEPGSGNYLAYPGTHKTNQKWIVEHPDLHINQNVQDVLGPDVEPYEFVAEVGDVLFVHYLTFHSGSACHSTNRLPRIGLHVECFRPNWLTSIDSADPALSPWERSLAHNGPYEASAAEAEYQAKERQRIMTLLDEQGIDVDEKWRHYSDWPVPPIL